MKKKIISLVLSVTFLVGMISLFTQSVAASNETTIYNFLINNMGMNTAAACGVLANIQKESNFNPNDQFIESDGSLSYGICQWNKTRLDALKSYCSRNGYDYTSLTGQLYYLKYELENNEPKALSYIKNVENTPSGAYTAGYNWAKYFERCREIYQGVNQYEQRGTLARDSYWPRYHTHSYSSSITTQPSCTANGVRTYACTCGASYTESISALGHSWGAWATTTAPTCITEGISTKTCSRCGQPQTQSIPPDGHRYSVETYVATCTDDGYDLHTCTVCGDQYTDNLTAANGHVFNGGICSICGEIDKTIQKGDINLDGIVSSADAVLLSRYLINKVQLSESQRFAADLNNDGKVSSADAVVLAKQMIS